MDLKLCKNEEARYIFLPHVEKYIFFYTVLLSFRTSRSVRKSRDSHTSPGTRKKWVLMRIIIFVGNKWKYIALSNGYETASAQIRKSTSKKRINLTDQESLSL